MLAGTHPWSSGTHFPLTMVYSDANAQSLVRKARLGTPSFSLKLHRPAWTDRACISPTPSRSRQGGLPWPGCWGKTHIHEGAIEIKCIIIIIMIIIIIIIIIIHANLPQAWTHPSLHMGELLPFLFLFFIISDIGQCVFHTHISLHCYTAHPVCLSFLSFIYLVRRCTLCGSVPQI